MRLRRRLDLQGKHAASQRPAPFAGTTGLTAVVIIFLSMVV